MRRDFRLIGRLIGRRRIVTALAACAALGALIGGTTEAARQHHQAKEPS